MAAGDVAVLDGLNVIARKGALFDGTDDRILLGTVANPHLNPTTQMSCFCWVKKAASSASSHTLIGKADAGVSKRSWVMFDSTTAAGKFRVTLSADGGSVNAKVYTSENVVFNRSWVHVGFTFNSGTLKLYINGVEDTNPTKSTDGTCNSLYQNTDIQAYVGAALSSGALASFCQGVISGVKIYERALSAAEVALVYAGTAPKDYQLICDLPLQEDYNDKTSYGINGTNSGTSFIIRDGILQTAVSALRTVYGATSTIGCYELNGTATTWAIDE